DDDGADQHLEVKQQGRVADQHALQVERHDGFVHETPPPSDWRVKRRAGLWRSRARWSKQLGFGEDGTGIAVPARGAIEVIAVAAQPPGIGAALIQAAAIVGGGDEDRIVSRDWQLPTDDGGPQIDAGFGMVETVVRRWRVGPRAERRRQG